MEKGRLIVTIISFVLAVIGIIFSLISVGISRSTNKKKSECTIRTMGTIINIEEKRINSSTGVHTVKTVSYFPTYSYYAGEREVVRKSNVGFQKGKFHPGQSIEVYYSPNDVENSYVPAFSAKFLVYVFGGVGVALLICSVAVMVITSIFFSGGF